MLTAKPVRSSLPPSPVASQPSLPSRPPVVGRGEIKWRRVLGTFQVQIPVSTKELLLPREEQRLAIFRWIGEAMPPTRRWYPVFQRYLQRIAGRVAGFGGDPARILPSPTGARRGLARPGSHAPTKDEEGAIDFTGKVSGLIYDRFGDFEGFLLIAEHGEHKFLSREAAIAELAGRAWRERLRVTVIVEREHPLRPRSIVVREPPVA